LNDLQAWGTGLMILTGKRADILGGNLVALLLCPSKIHTLTDPGLDPDLRCEMLTS